MEKVPWVKKGQKRPWMEAIKGGRVGLRKLSMAGLWKQSKATGRPMESDRMFRQVLNAPPPQTPSRPDWTNPASNPAPPDETKCFNRMPQLLYTPMLDTATVRRRETGSPRFHPRPTRMLRHQRQLGAQRREPSRATTSNVIEHAVQATRAVSFASSPSNFSCLKRRAP